MPKNKIGVWLKSDKLKFKAEKTLYKAGRAFYLAKVFSSDWRCINYRSPTSANTVLSSIKKNLYMIGRKTDGHTSNRKF